MRSDPRDASHEWLDVLLDAQVDGKPLRASVGNSAICVALTLGHDEIQRKAGDVVRMALAAEFRREPLRRDDIARDAIGKEGTRAFPIIVAQAQHILRETFGMELVELRPRGAENPALVEQAAEIDERLGRKRAKTEERRDVRRAFALRSTLPPSIIAALAGSTDNAEPALDWAPADGHSGGMGLLFVILAVVLLSGRRCADDRLRANLAQLGLSADRALPPSLQPVGIDPSAAAARGRFDPLDLDTFLAALQRQGYLESARLATSGETQQKNEWRWGARAEAEIGEKAVASFVSRLYTPKDERDESTDLMQRIERAAGTPLV